MTAPAQTIVAAPAPEGETPYEDYQLTVGGKPVPVYSCRVSAIPFNQVWPGYQRPLDQTELAGFASWDMHGAVRIEIETAQPLQSVVVRPASLGYSANRFLQADYTDEYTPLLMG